jgi:hypothetical protein
MSQYSRPKGVMGGPCLHCGLSQPEHVGLTCTDAKERRGAKLSLTLAKAHHEATLNTVKGHLQTMIHSAEVYVDKDDVVTAYKIKTGALHKLIGFLELTVPVNLPVVNSGSAGESGG